MIVKTRYRDIPIEEVRKCFPEADAAEWEKARAKEVEIVIPATNEPHGVDVCQEPLYYEAHSWFVACPHIAEIGD